MNYDQLVSESQDRIINNILNQGINDLISPNQNFQPPQKNFDETRCTYSYDKPNKKIKTDTSFPLPSNLPIRNQIIQSTKKIEKMKKNIINLQTKLSGVEPQQETRLNTVSSENVDSYEMLPRTREVLMNKSFGPRTNLARPVTNNRNGPLKRNGLGSTANNRFANTTTQIKKVKEKSANEIWKEKYELLKKEYQELSKQLTEEKKKNSTVKNKIKDIKKKELTLAELYKINGDLLETKDNLKHKFEESEKIRKEQIKLINELQNGVNNMRANLNCQSPSV